MGYKVLLPTAGTGSRLGEATKYVNKALVSIGNKPTVSRIIEMFPEDCEFVIPVGYKGDLVREFLELAYPNRRFYFVDVKPYEGEGSGLGLSVLACMEYLQEPFVFCSCDTLVLEAIPEPYQNWMGYGERERLKEYRTIGIDARRYVEGIYEKGTFQNGVVKPYIGLAGITSYQEFWEAMKRGGVQAVIQGESYGLDTLVQKKKVKACSFTWYDTGVPSELSMTREYFRDEDSPNILAKADEDIWFMEDSVIKFSDNEKFISDRVKRAELLRGYIPSITGVTKHMYSYTYVPGKVMSACVNLPNFKKLLTFSKEFWIIKKLDEGERQEFVQCCQMFYREKTYERIDKFYQKYQKEDNIQIINGIRTPRLSELLERLDWDWLTDGLPGQFHGDYHFENIVFNQEQDRFCFLDWRQSFGISLSVGDIYYDLGKLLHGLIICHELIARDDYKIEWVGDEINYDFHRKESLVECEKYFYRWLDQEGYDKRKVRMMAALIFINIAALHQFPYGLMLYALGKKMLFEGIDS